MLGRQEWMTGGASTLRLDIEVSLNIHLINTNLISIYQLTETKMTLDSEPSKGSTCWPWSIFPVRNQPLKSAPPLSPFLLFLNFRKEKFRSFSLVVTDANEELWKISNLGQFGASLSHSFNETRSCSQVSHCFKLVHWTIESVCLLSLFAYPFARCVRPACKTPHSFFKTFFRIFAVCSYCR